MRSDLRGSLLLALGLLTLCWSQGARAYPQYIAKGYTSCTTCHYSPTGGGLANSYGHLVTAATFPDEAGFGPADRLRELLSKPDVTGRGPTGRSELHVDAGVDTRFMLLGRPSGSGGSGGVSFFPMLLEVGGVAAYGPGAVYASLAPRPTLTDAGERAMRPISREHWVQLRVGEAQSVRLGRMLLPFGLRLADHAQPTRESFGFDKFDQNYALAWDLLAERSQLSVAAFAGSDLTALDEVGGAASYTFFFPSRLALGASLLGAEAVASTRFAASLFARWRVGASSYVLAELAGQRRATKGTDAQVLEAASFLRVGTFALESLDVYAQVGGRTMQDAYETTKLRYLLGVDWKVFPWVELSPAYVFEEDVETGPRHSGLAQLHVFW